MDLGAAIALLDAEPELLELNRHVEQKTSEMKIRRSPLRHAADAA